MSSTFIPGCRAMFSAFEIMRAKRSITASTSFGVTNIFPEYGDRLSLIIPYFSSSLSSLRVL